MCRDVTIQVHGIWAYGGTAGYFWRLQAQGKLKLIEREVKILKNVSHENIIELKEVFETAEVLLHLLRFSPDFTHFYCGQGAQDRFLLVEQVPPLSCLLSQLPFPSFPHFLFPSHSHPVPFK